MTHRQRVRMLLGLWGLWAVVSVAVFGLSSEPERVPLQNVSGAVASVAGARGGSRTPGLQVDLKLFEASRSQRAQRFSPPRNIFIPTVPVTEGGPLDAVAMPEANVEFAPEDNSSAADSSTPVRYLGYVELGANGRETVVAVVAAGDELHMVRPGERIGDHLLVKTVTPEHLTTIDPQSRREERLPLVDVAPIDSPSES